MVPWYMPTSRRPIKQLDQKFLTLPWKQQTLNVETFCNH